MLKRYCKPFFDVFSWVMLTALFVAAGFNPVKTIIIPADQVTTDNLGNLYLLNGNTLKKYGPEGDFLAEFTKTNIDRFSWIDASDPFKILLFSKTSAEIIRLDNQLAQHGTPLSLYAKGIFSPALACSSYDNGIWVWDNTLSEFIRLDQKGDVDQRSANLSHLLVPDEPLAMILEKDLLLYASQPGKGVFIFDRYGNFLKNIPLKNVGSFQLISGRIIYPNDGRLFSFDTKNLRESSFTLPVTSCRNALIEGKYLYVHQPDTVTIFLSPNL